MMEFLSDPRPERICNYSFLDPHTPQDMLSVGVKVIERSHTGLKVIPHKEVVFAIGKTKNGKTHDADERSFAMMTLHAREIALRIIEMCDIIDGEENAKAGL